MDRSEIEDYRKFIARSFITAVHNEQARWMVNVEFKRNGRQPLSIEDRGFVGTNHRDLNKGYILH